jgi:3-oxoadipate enol-lactonase
MYKFGKGIFHRESVADRLDEIKKPALVVVGEKDVATPKKKAEKIAAGIPYARLEVIPDAGHMCTVEKPEEVNRILGSFLSSL